MSLADEDFIIEFFDADSTGMAVDFNAVIDVGESSGGSVVEVFSGIPGPPGQAPAPVTLVDAAVIAVNASLGNEFHVTLGGNRTLGNPTNLSPGQMLMFVVKQDATGGRTLAYGSMYNFGDIIEDITLSTAANAVDKILVHFDAIRNKLDVVAFQGGF